MSSGQQHLASGIGRRPRRDWLLVATLAASETTASGVLTYAFGVAAIPGRSLARHHGASALMTTGAGAASLLVLTWAQVSDLAAFDAMETCSCLAFVCSAL